MRYLEMVSTHQQLWSNSPRIHDLSELHEHTESYSIQFSLPAKTNYVAPVPPLFPKSPYAYFSFYSLKVSSSHGVCVLRTRFNDSISCCNILFLQLFFKCLLEKNGW